jgi:CBS-domain-containing membrane protein
MAHHNVSAIAILNDDGTLLSTLTAKDIKVIDKDALFTKLYKASREFVGLARPSLKTQYPYYFCHPDDTIEQLIQKLSFLRVHRIFVINEERIPISVISLCDILHALSL